MIITRTPMRVSFLGGGTDYPKWFTKNRGLCVGGAINKYSVISARHLPPYHEYKDRVVYSKIETVKHHGDIEHKVVKAALSLLAMDSEFAPGLEITHMSDMPGRSGLGSSSSFAVGLLHALKGLKGEMALPHNLASAATHIEQEMLGETGGCQDQAWAAHGGLNVLCFEKDGSVNVYPLPLSADDVDSLECHLALYYTGLSRTSSEVSKGYASTLETSGKHQWAMVRMADEGVVALERKNWHALGVLMDRAWHLKRSLPGVSTPEIDQAYAAGREAGAVGGKLLGAGGGGCLLFVMPNPAFRVGLNQLMSGMGLIEVGFQFDFDGSKIVYVDRENLSEYRSLSCE